jgi:integrase/recombinase XerD
VLLPATVPERFELLPGVATSAITPLLIAEAGKLAEKAFWEYFVATIRNKNTRMAYARQVAKFFDWCTKAELTLELIEPHHVAYYLEIFPGSPPSCKQALAAIRKLFDWLVIRQIMPVNPAHPVKGPTYIVKKGKTPVLSAEELKDLFEAIDTSHVVGLRDRALIATMFYSFGRVSAVINMKVEDFFPKGKRYWFGLHEKGGKYHEVPAHHLAEEYLDEYLAASGISEDPKSPLWRTTRGRSRELTEKALHRVNVWQMIQRRAKAAGILTRINCHTFRASGITIYRKKDGRLEHAQQIANHSSPKTTKLYDHSDDDITLEEIERISL